MGRTRRTAIDTGFGQNGQAWQITGSGVSFPNKAYVEYDLPFKVVLGTNNVSQVVLWNVGIVSFGPVTQEQIDFVSNGLPPFAGTGVANPADNPGFPGEFLSFRYHGGTTASAYSFAIGPVDFEQPFVLDQAQPTAFFDISGEQVILVEDGFTILSNTSSSHIGYKIGSQQELTTASPSFFVSFEKDGINDLFTFNGSDVGDDITGTAFNDILSGGGGNDILDGGPGVDIAIISGMSSESEVQRVSDRSFIVSGPDGTDTLIDIESLEFDDKVLSLVDIVPPEITNFLPADGLSDASIGINIAVTFNEAIARGFGSIELRTGSSTGPLIESFDAAASARLNVSGSQLTIDPTNELSPETTYFVVIAPGTVRDIAGNPFAGTSTYEFTTAQDNDAPVVANAIANQSLDEDAPWSFVVPANAFSDADRDTLSFTASLDNDDPLPAWLTFTAATRTFAGTPPLDFNGAIDLKVTASDGSLSASDSFTLTITSVNDPPTLDTPIADQALDEDTAWSFTVPADSFSDIDEDTLIYSATLDNDDPLPQWLAFNAATRTFAGTPPLDFNGAIDLKVTASDGSLSASDSFTLTIAPINDAPVVANAITDQSSDEDTAWTFVVPANSFSDIDGDTLTYSATLDNDDPLPVWLTFTAATRTFAGTPPLNFNGTLNLKVTASDGSLSASDSFTLTIAPVNDAPVAVDDDGFVTPFGTALVTATSQLTANDSDVDGDTLEVVSAQDAQNGTVSLSNGQITFTPEAGYSGTASYTYTVSDGQGGSDTAIVALVVGELINDAPVFADPALQLNAPAGAAATIASVATDPDGNALTYGLSTPEKGVVSYADGVLTYTPAPFATGTDSVILTADDGFGGLASQTINIAISAPPAAPADFVLLAASGWTGSIGGNGRVAGTNASEDITLLSGAIDLNGSFNRGGDIVRFNGDASTYFVTRLGSSTAILTDNQTLSVTIPLGTTGLDTIFDDGSRTLAFNGGYRLGEQIFGLDSARIVSPPGTTTPPGASDSDAQARLVLAGRTLGALEDSHVTIGGNVSISGSNNVDVITLDQAGGQFVFDGSFNRGGDIIVLSGDASSYSAVRQGSSTIIIEGAQETLTIPIGLAGLTLRFDDGDRTLIFANSQYLIGDQEITRTPSQLTPALSNEDIDVGTLGSPITFDASSGAIAFADDVSVTTNVIIQNFGSDDRLLTNASDAGVYSYTTPDNEDLVLTFQSSPEVSNTIVFDNVLVGKDFSVIGDYASAAAAVGFEFIVFG